VPCDPGLSGGENMTSCIGLLTLEGFARYAELKTDRFLYTEKNNLSNVKIYMKIPYITGKIQTV